MHLIDEKHLMPSTRLTEAEIIRHVNKECEIPSWFMSPAQIEEEFKRPGSEFQKMVTNAVAQDLYHLHTIEKDMSLILFNFEFKRQILAAEALLAEEEKRLSQPVTAEKKEHRPTKTSATEMQVNIAETLQKEIKANREEQQKLIAKRQKLTETINAKVNRHCEKQIKLVNKRNLANLDGMAKVVNQHLAGEVHQATREKILQELAEARRIYEESVARTPKKVARVVAAAYATTPLPADEKLKSEELEIRRARVEQATRRTLFATQIREGVPLLKARWVARKALGSEENPISNSANVHLSEARTADLAAHRSLQNEVDPLTHQHHELTEKLIRAVAKGELLAQRAKEFVLHPHEEHRSRSQ